MLKAKKLEEFSSVKIKEYRSSSRKVLSCPRQKGSILIALIVTMVVMASLGAGMVYLTTTSTFQELFANNHARAYYAAESGGRYATARIREAYAQTTTTARDAILATIPGTYYDGTATNNKGNFVISPSPLAPTGSPASIAFTSTGTVNSGFLQARRILSYRIQPANQSMSAGGGGGPTGPINFNTTPLTFDAGMGGGPSSQVNTLSATEIDLRAASPVKSGIVSNTAMCYTGNYDVQVKIGAYKAGTSGDASVFNLGLFFNGYPTTGNGYYLTIMFNDETDPSKWTNYPALYPLRTIDGKAKLILWQQVAGTVNWIAYATINNSALPGGLFCDSHGCVLDPDATLLVKVSRIVTATASCSTPPCNEIRAYFGSPTGGTGDTNATNFTRKGYGLWVTPSTDIKWPSYSTTSPSWPATNDYFTIASNYNTGILTWVKNSSYASWSPDTYSMASTSITDAVVTSTVLTGATNCGIGLFVENTKDPWATFFDLGINATGGSGSADGSGEVIVSP